MSLPPLRPLHPAWTMVFTIGFAGASLTSLQAGNQPLSMFFIAAAAACAAAARRAIRHHRRG